MTRNTSVSAFICGSHICMLVPSEFDSIKVGPLWRPSTETLSRHPSASIIGMFYVPSSRAGLTRASIENESFLSDGLPDTFLQDARSRFSPAMTSGDIQRSEQAVDQGLGGALIGRRLEQRGNLVRIELRGHFRIAHEHIAQMFLVRDCFLAGGLDQMMCVGLADLLRQREGDGFRHDQPVCGLEILPHARGVDFE